jgi:hypothetical protein
MGPQQIWSIVVSPPPQKQSSGACMRNRKEHLFPSCKNLSNRNNLDITCTNGSFAHMQKTINIDMMKFLPTS